MKDKLDQALQNAKDAIAPPHDAVDGRSLSTNFEEAAEGAKDAVKPPGRREEGVGIPAVATPDQTRTDGMIADPGLSHADTAGLVEDRKREGNLEGM